MQGTKGELRGWESCSVGHILLSGQQHTLGEVALTFLMEAADTLKVPSLEQSHCVAAGSGSGVGALHCQSP